MATAVTTTPVAATAAEAVLAAAERPLRLGLLLRLRILAPGIAAGDLAAAEGLLRLEALAVAPVTATAPVVVTAAIAKALRLEGRRLLLRRRRIVEAAVAVAV